MQKNDPMKELNPEAHKLNDKIVKTIEKDGPSSPKLIELLMELREQFKEAEDPTVTKVLRLTAEHLEEHGTFELNILSDVKVVETEEGEDETPVTEEAMLENFSASENLKYLMTLCMDAQNKYNREELFEVRDNLMNW